MYVTVQHTSAHALLLYFGRATTVDTTVVVTARGTNLKTGVKLVPNKIWYSTVQIFRIHPLLRGWGQDTILVPTLNKKIRWKNSQLPLWFLALFQSRPNQNTRFKLLCTLYLTSNQTFHHFGRIRWKFEQINNSRARTHLVEDSIAQVKVRYCYCLVATCTVAVRIRYYP